MADIHKLIAAISPDVYCQKTKEIEGEEVNLPKKIKFLAKIDGLTDDVLKLATPLNWKDLPFYNYDAAKADALNLWGLKSPIEQHKLTYDSPLEGIEPVYFWLLDFLNGPYRSVEKITDNFVASPGSGHFSEMQGKATQMQQEASRTMGNVNTVLKSVLNLVYDLKEFRIRLKPYKTFTDEKSNQEEKYKALLSLKQIWLDNVDIRKGRGSINALSSGELDFVTLRDAFMSIRSVEQASLPENKGGLDLNERVKKILIQRAEEFFLWIKESYSSLKQRYEIERNYLKSQVNMLKLYAKWVKPYLVAAQKLQQNYESKNAALVTAFNTMILELKLIATSPYDIKDDVAAGLLPDLFNNYKGREYHKVLVLELDFRGIPQRVSQRGDWSFGGKVDIKFTSYALNEQELKVLNNELNKDDLKSVLGLVEGATKESLDQIDKDIRALTEGKEDEEIDKEDKQKKEDAIRKKEEKAKGDDFGLKALFSAFKIKKKEKEKFDEKKTVNPAPDNEYEKVVRSQCAIDSRSMCFTIFDTYKKAHGMPSHASPFDG
ncbi:MAG: hypothetical protein ACP5N7_06615 [Candidatus Pacearchaeota archaeon]